MAFNLIDRPEKREFRYKPRFYQREEDKPMDNSGEDYDPEKFAERLHRSWSSKRKSQQDRNKFPLKTVIWLMFIVIVLGYFFFKFMDK
ncbi:MAG: hypothetical protein J5644_05300 [Bacteroidales bacterium]|nr:hypothetical protein [Bacteroidales bacterium]